MATISITPSGTFKASVRRTGLPPQSKPLRPELYSYKVQAELNRILLEQERERVLEELTKVNERLAHETTTDSLTQVYNRRYFTQRLQQTFARFERYGESYALVLLDLDNFKNINDTYGHEFGDEVLRSWQADCVRSNRVNDMPSKQTRSLSVLGNDGEA